MYGTSTAWTHVPEIRNKLYWRVRHIQKNGIGMIANYYRTLGNNMMTEDEAREEKERMYYDRFISFFENRYE